MEITKEQLDALAKKYRVGSIEIRETTEEEMNAFPDPIARITACFRLYEKDYPKLENANIVITEEDDKCIVGVKAVGYLPDGSRSWFGDLCEVSKNEPISKLFDGLNSAFKNVEGLIKEQNKDVEA